MLSLFFFSTVGLAALPSGHHPVVIAGPFMGQNLEVLNEKSFTICNTKGEYKHLWANIAGVDDFYCLSQGLKIAGWDDVNKVSLPTENIKVRPFGYAGSDRDQIEGIGTFAGNDILLNAPENLVPRLEKIGYKLGESVFGHTYDWRLGVRDWEIQYYPVFKEIVEDAVAKNNGSPVVLTGISMAGQYTHAFLSWAKRKFGAEWAKKNIHAFAPVAAGFNGAHMATSAAIDSILGTWGTDGECPNCEPSRQANTNLHRRRLDGLTDWMKSEAVALGDDVLRDLFASFPALYMNSPGIDYSTNPPTDPEVVTIRNAVAPAECSATANTATICGAKEDAAGYNFEKGFLGRDQCGECNWTYGECPAGFDRAHDGWTQDLCCKRHQCKPRTYKASEMPELFRELGQELHAQLYAYALTLDTTSDPGVPVHCIFSHNVQTFNRLSLSLNRDEQDVEGNVIFLDDGDQTVNHDSLEVCTRWKSTLKSYRVSGVAHSMMLNIEQVLDVIIAVATENQAHLDAWRDIEYDEVRPQQRIVDPSVLLKRDMCVICEHLADLDGAAMYMDPNTDKETKCSDADAFCTKNSCGSLEETRKFFKENTKCCNRRKKLAVSPALLKLQETPYPTVDPSAQKVAPPPTPPPTAKPTDARTYYHA